VVLAIVRRRPIVAAGTVDRGIQVVATPEGPFNGGRPLVQIADHVVDLEARLALGEGTALGE
jgi:hypothetical protein